MKISSCSGVGWASSRGRRGFTLIELLVVIAIIGILAAILFPVFGRARENARRSTCQSNLKQIGLGILQYAQDYDETLPYDLHGQQFGVSTTNGVDNPLVWTARIQPYLKSTQLFRCPSTTRLASVSPTFPEAQLMGYWTVGGMFARPGNRPLTLAAVQRPAEMPAVYDDLDTRTRSQLIYRPWWNGTIFSNYVATANASFILPRAGVHFEGINALYGDGHVKFVKYAPFYVQARQDPTAA